MIDLVIFDCDGVLIDSEIISAEVLIAELDQIGITIDRTHVRQHFLGRSFPTVAKSIREDFATKLPEDFEMRYRAALLKRFDTELHPTPGIHDVLATLGRAKCVATSSSPPRVARSLMLTDLAQYFGDHVYTASMVQRGKPFPDLFLHAAQTLGVAPDRTLVVEDSLPGMTAAQAARMQVCAYLGGSHLRGTEFQVPDGTRPFDNWADFPQVLSEFDARTP